MPTYFVSDYEFARAHGIPVERVAAVKKQLEKEGAKLAVDYDPADYAADEDEPDTEGDARKAVRTKVVKRSQAKTE